MLKPIVHVQNDYETLPFKWNWNHASTWYKTFLFIPELSNDIITHETTPYDAAARQLYTTHHTMSLYEASSHLLDLTTDPF
jgi:hypothetical protein